MFRGDVRDLVPEHAGQLRFVLRQPERAAGDVDDAARRGERVDAVGVEDDELPVEVGRELACARTVPTSVTYFVTSLS